MDVRKELLIACCECLNCTGGKVGIFKAAPLSLPLQELNINPPPQGGGGTTYNGLYGEAPPKRGNFFRLQVYKWVSAPSCDHFGRRGEWKKYLTTKMLAKVTKWQPTDLKRNLLEKLSKILDEFNQ